MTSTRMASMRTIFLAVLSLVAFLASGRATAAPGVFDLTSPANGAWCTATCTFTWQAASSAISYQLYVDGALKKDAITPTSPPAYALSAGEALGDGWHAWYIVARDSGGGTGQSTSTYSVRVDTTPPTAPTPTAPTEGGWASASSPTFSWGASSDVGSGLASYEVWINGALVQGGISTNTTSTRSGSG